MNYLSFGDSHSDEQTLRFLEKQVRMFIKHLKENYPDSDLTRNLLAKFS